MKLFLKIAYVETFYEDFLEFDSFPVSVGRDPTNKIKLMGHEISKQHAELYEKDGRIFLRDLGSRTGIWLKGKLVKELEIVEGSHLRIGHALLSFSFIAFPLEQTISHATEDLHLAVEPITKRIESAFTSNLLWVLILILGILSYYTEPDFYRRGDFVKKLTNSVAISTFLIPFIVTLLIVILRKVNRGDYSWKRSFCLTYLLLVVTKLIELLSSSLCWFSTFNKVWSSSIFGIFTMSFLFYWWFLAVAKEGRFKQRVTRSVALSVIVYALVMGAQLLTTGYQSEYQIETCDSLTGWHWGPGGDLASIDKFLNESAQELSEEK